MRRTVTWLAATAVAVGLLAVPAGAGDGGPPAVPELGGSTASLSEPGRELVRDADLGDAPRYALRADVDPESGRVRGELHASLPSSARGHLVFRMFPGLPELDTKLEVTDVRVDGQRVDAEVDAARLLLPAPRGGGGAVDGRVDVRLSFSYVVPKIEPSFNPFDVGDTLDPSAIGLLGRHDDLASLGHWFPVWLPPGSVDEADPSGFGDIGNFPPR